MVVNINIFQGIHYRNPWFYYIQNILKLGFGHDLRFKIAARYLKPKDAVLDVCAGPGQLKRYLPDGCRYNAIEASPQFSEILSRNGTVAHKIDLHQGLPAVDLKADVVVMIVSLSQFRDSSLSSLLEGFKKIGRRVVIVEDVLDKPRGSGSFLQKAMNYLCAVDYYRPAELFTAEEFQRAMRCHGYVCTAYTRRYWVGTFDNPIAPR